MSALKGVFVAAIAVSGFTFLSRSETTPSDPAAPVAATPSGPTTPAASVLKPDPFDDDDAMAKHAEAIANYTLRAKVDTTLHTLHGEGEIVWKNASETKADELYVHLYLNAFKNEKTVFMRKPVYGFRGSGTPTSWGWIKVTKFHIREMDVDAWALAEKHSPDDADDETDIKVVLPRSVEPGESITVDVAWDEKLPEVLFRTGYRDSFHMFGQWFPKIARREKDGRWAHFTFDRLTEFYADFGRYDVSIDVPEGFVVGASGKEEPEKKDKGRVVHRFIQDDVHDFSFTAWDKFQERKDEHAGVAIRTLYPPGYTHDAAVEVADVSFALDHLGKAYGHYPYDHLTLVHPPDGADEAGGMEYPTLITTGGPWWLPETGVKAIETTAVHELGHQWFYGLVATNEHAWPFLDEGVNSYAEIDTMEARYPNESALNSFGLKLGIAAIYRGLAAEAELNAPVAQSTTKFMTGGDYGGLVYERTATILLTLGHVYGDDAVRQIVGRYARKYRFQHPTPDDFVAEFRAGLGDEAADNLHAALFDRATVDFVADGFTSHEDEGPKGIFGDPDHPTEIKGGSDKLWKGEALVRRRGGLVFPVDIELVGSDGTKTRTHWDGQGSETRLPYEGKSELTQVIVDPDHKVLLDDNLANNARSLRQKRISPRVFERTWWSSELLLSAVLP